MAIITAANSDPTQASGPNTGNYTLPLVALTSLFFMWGLITCLNDILIPHLKNVFSLNYTQAMLIQFCFFGAYFVVSLPAGAIVRHTGYKGGIIIGLLLAAFGCFLFVPAASVRSYGLFLGALFVLASGITFLQVAANPYVAILGNPLTASSRLTMAQAFNSLGTTIAPFFGALLILSAVSVDLSSLSAAEVTEYRQHEADAVKMPYIMLACGFLVLAAAFAWFKLPSVPQDETHATSESVGSAWGHRHLVLGAVAIFSYVGAEVAIGSFLVNFMGLPEVAGFDEAKAAPFIAYYWGGAMVGRFIGAVVMRHIAGGLVLGFCSLASSGLLLVAIMAEGQMAMWAALAIGLFNSVMFPTIFSLALHKLGEHTSQGSGILCLAIVGGAIVPVVTGAIADVSSIQVAFLLPLLCYVYVVFYGLVGSRVQQNV